MLTNRVYKHFGVSNAVKLCYDVIRIKFCWSRDLAVYHMQVMYRRGDSQIGKRSSGYYHFLPHLSSFMINVP